MTAQQQTQTVIAETQHDWLTLRGMLWALKCEHGADAVRRAAADAGFGEQFDRAVSEIEVIRARAFSREQVTISTERL